MTIDETKQAAGQAILELTDRFGFDALAAGWLYDRPTDTWRYLLVTQMLRSEGPRWIYDRLLRIFQRYHLPDGVSPLDIFVIDEATEMAAFGKPLFAVDQDRTIPGMRMFVTQPITVNEFVVTDGFVAFLRRVPVELRKNHRNPARRFDKTIQKLAA